MKTRLLHLCTLGLAACGSETDLGDVTVGSHTMHVTLEGSGKAGKKSNYAIKPVDSTKPDLVQCGWGTSAADATQATGDYDSGDGDYDCEATRSTDGTGQLWISVTYGSDVFTANVAVP